ncbi:hypothetical protein P691DRAFT_809738 [Macrolepiota fuliginosa MF-IS2]|uniref:NACHT domain-containing protein n=1 Tax=Macrolepiota fuliginosa MF-IS2 TaxID=1400762 RepID=A0A9P5X181_9AGAR|nr:hypothetical protein P691DRAFT_809738 [Macrolepiota fuliginosa MF-IS2]
MERRKRKRNEVNDNPDENSPNVYGRKKGRRSTEGHNGGDSSPSWTAGSSNIQAISSSGFSRELPTNVVGNPLSVGSSSRVFHNGSSGSMASYPTPYTGYFSGAHHFTINNPTMMDGESTNERRSMKLLSKRIIVGAEFDSSDHRPSCHPDTRLDISHTIQSWMYNLARKYNILWLHGPAGVGKSAILQTIAEAASKLARPILGATLFFSRPNNRDDPRCAFITIAYRLAVRYPPYRQYIVGLLAVDPQLVEKSLAEQFETFIVKPFAVKQLLAGINDTVLLLLDGLDECNGEEAQREIILLIGKFILQYPTSPLIWLIASRPEPHIQNAFASKTLRSSYEEIQVFVDSDQGRRDVEKYLRESFVDIRERYPQSIPSSLQQWPSESDFSTIATQSSGMFIFPSTIIRFIGDTAYADPDSRLTVVLEVIESTSSSVGGQNPFATLDVLYTRIISEVPRDVLPTTLSLLVIYAAGFNLPRFAWNCNWLGVTQGRAYSALLRLHSVLNVPEPRNAFQENLQAFHSSFYDYLTSPSRSGPFYVIAPKIIRPLLIRCIRILLESHSIETSDVDMTRISLFWPIGDLEYRLDIQRRIFNRSLDYLTRVLNEFVDDSIRNEFSRLAAFFQDLDFGEALHYMHPFDVLMYPELVFATSLEHWGVLRTVPLQFFNFNDVRFDLDLEIWRYEERGTSLRVGWHTSRQGDAVPAFQRIFHDATIVNSQGQVSYDHEFTELPNKSWKTDLQKNLATWTDMAPSHTILMLGRGRKSCACFQFHVSGELWVLRLPCVQSS